MATFGDTTEHASAFAFEEDLVGLKGVSPASNGTATSITAFIAISSGTPTGKVKAALYDEADDSLVAQTAEKDVTYSESFTWETFTFSEGVDVYSAKSYYIVVFNDTVANNPRLAVTTTAGSYKRINHNGLTYPTFSDPIVPVVNNGSGSIYCTYTPPEVDHTAKPAAFELTATLKAPTIIPGYTATPTTLALNLNLRNPTYIEGANYTAIITALPLSLNLNNVIAGETGIGSASINVGTGTTSERVMDGTYPKTKGLIGGFTSQKGNIPNLIYKIKSNVSKKQKRGIL